MGKPECGWRLGLCAGCELCAYRHDVIDHPKQNLKGITQMETQLASLKDVREFFGMDVTSFRVEWTALDSNSKTQIREGIAKGTYSY